MIFYKYQRSDNLAFSMLRRGEIYFASPSELNDASECRPRFIFKGSEELWQRLAQYILLEACCSSDYFQPDRLDGVKPILNLSERIGTCLKIAAGNRDLGIESLREMFRDALEHHLPSDSPQINCGFYLHLVNIFIKQELPRVIAEDKYIASFSRNATNPTMWGHYADAERGFVIVYETTNDYIQVHSPINLLHGQRPSKNFEEVIEIGIYKDENLELKEVRYGRRPPKVNAFHRLIHKFLYSEMEYHYDVPDLVVGDAEAKEEGLVGLVKYSDWRYEKELRAFFPAIGTILPDARVLQVGLPNMKGVIFGPRMSCENKARTVLCCHLLVESRKQLSETQDEFQFFQARQTVDRFDYQILPVGILDEHYFARHIPLKPMQRLDGGTSERIRAAAASIAASSSTLVCTKRMGEQDTATNCSRNQHNNLAIE